MKKLYFTIVFALLALVGNAQTNPNRVLVRDVNGAMTGYLAERIDSIFFGKVEGKVVAEITFDSYTKTEEASEIQCKVKNSPACKGFKIACVATNVAKNMTTEAQKANYIDRYGSSIMYDDFSNGAKLTIPNKDQTFYDDSEYTLMTLGFDEYGIGCGVSEVTFKTPKAALAGNPTVTAEVSEITTTSFKVTVTPNEDCYGYYACSFDVAAGGILGQFSTMGSFFGFANVGEMIKGWGSIEHSGVETIEWKNQEPGSEYEVGIVPLDMNGNLGDYIVIKVKTQGAGGDGAALVSAEAPADEFYKFNDENNVENYVQRVIFTPNDQTNIYRDGLVEADKYDQDPEFYNNIVLFPEQTTAYTNHTGVDSYLWNVKASTRYYAIAVGQNNKGEWGEVSKFEFSTPDPSKAEWLQGEAKTTTVAAGVPARISSASTTLSMGAVAPKTFVKKGITMTVK